MGTWSTGRDDAGLIQSTNAPKNPFFDQVLGSYSHQANHPRSFRVFGDVRRRPKLVSGFCMLVRDSSATCGVDSPCKLGELTSAIAPRRIGSGICDIAKLFSNSKRNDVEGIKCGRALKSSRFGLPKSLFVSLICLRRLKSTPSRNVNFGM